MTEMPKTEALLQCPQCRREMRLYGIEADNPKRELYTFECEACQQVEVRGVRIG